MQQALGFRVKLGCPKGGPFLGRPTLRIMAVCRLFWGPDKS